MVIDNNMVINDDLDFGEDGESGHMEGHSERSDMKTSSG